MTITAPDPSLWTDTSSHRLDEKLARAALLWSLEADRSPDEAADHLVRLAAGNRTAVERALGRIERRDGTRPLPATADRAVVRLRLTLERGSWAW